MPTTSNFGWTTPADTDLVKDGAAAIRTLGNGIDTSFLDLKGGTTDQVLAKNSNTDLDFKWVAQDDSNAIQNAIVDAKGDLISATAADTPARLAVGTNGQVLTADSTTSTGLKWAAPAAGGKVLQIVRNTDTTSRSTTSTSFVDVTGVSVSITPTSATSSILLILSANLQADPDVRYIAYQITNSSNVAISGAESQEVGTAVMQFPGVLMAFDSPATTSAVTYKMRFKTFNALTTAYVRGDLSTTQLFALEIGV